MIPRFRPDLNWSEIGRIWKSNDISPETLERAFQESLGYSHAVWFPYARVGARAFLENLLSPGRVVLSAFNCTAVGAAVVSAGFEPLYVDTEPRGFAEDPEEFCAALSEPDTCAGIAVAPWGIPAHSYVVGKPVLYDLALAGLSDAKPLLKSEDAVLYSTGWGKPLSAYRGGFLCTESAEAAQRWRSWRDARVGRGHRVRDLVRMSALRLGFDPRLFAISSRLGKSTALGKSLLGKEAELLPSDWNQVPASGVLSIALDRIRDRRNLCTVRLEQVRRYSELFLGINEQDVRLPPGDVPLSHYPLRVSDSAGLKEALKARGYFSSTDLFSRLLSDYPAFSGACYSELGRARLLTAMTIHLPLYFGLSVGDQKQVAEAVWGWRTESASVRVLWESKESEGIRAVSET